MDEKLVSDCEVCGKPLPTDTLGDCLCASRQDAIWYTNIGQSELVVIVEGTRLSIERVGYTHFYYYPDKDNTDVVHELWNTSDFLMWGITNDEELIAAYNDELIEIDDSPWFEIYDIQEQEYLDTLTFVDLDGAYKYVLDLPDKDRKWALPE